MTDYLALAKRLDSEGHHWSGKPALLFFEAAEEIKRLSDLIHKIAVARRGACPDVDEQWESLPAEIEQMWRDLDESVDDRSRL
jgi:hypothetical protein